MLPAAELPANAIARPSDRVQQPSQRGGSRLRVGSRPRTEISSNPRRHQDPALSEPEQVSATDLPAPVSTLMYSSFELIKFSGNTSLWGSLRFQPVLARVSLRTRRAPSSAFAGRAPGRHGANRESSRGCSRQSRPVDPGRGTPARPLCTTPLRGDNLGSCCHRLYTTARKPAWLSQVLPLELQRRFVTALNRSLLQHALGSSEDDLRRRSLPHCHRLDCHGATGKEGFETRCCRAQLNHAPSGTNWSVDQIITDFVGRSPAERC